MPTNKNRYKILLDDTEYTDPENWINFVPTTQRHPVYRTLLSLFSEEAVILVKDAKYYVDTVYAQYGNTATIDVKWQEYDFATDAYTNVWALGQLNLMEKYKRERDRTEVGFEPSGFIMNLLNRDEIDLDLQELTDVDGGAVTAFTSETETITVDAQTINLFLETTQGAYNETTTDNELQDYYIQVPVSTVVRNELGDNFQIVEEQASATAFTNTITDLLPFIDAQEFINGTISGSYNMTIGVTFEATSLPFSFSGLQGSINLALYIHEANSLVQKVSLDTYSFNESATDVNEHTVENAFSGTFSQALDFSQKHEVRFVAEIIFTDLGTTPELNQAIYEIDLTSSSVDYKWEPEYTDTTAKVMLPWEFFLRICQKITGRNDCLRSPFFGRTDGEVYTYGSDGEGAFLAVTNGYQLRGFNINDYPITANLMDAFKSFDAVYCLGLGITYESGVPYILIDKMTSLMDNTGTFMSVNAEYPGVEWEAAMEYIWGNVKCGFTESEADGYLTRFSAHSQRSYAVPFLSKFTDNTYDSNSTIVGSGHIIDEIRIQRAFKRQSTAKTEYDDKLFFIEVERSGASYARVNSSSYTEVYNIDNTTTQYNLSITPAKNILRHAPLLLAGLSKRIQDDAQFNSFLNFQSGRNNTDLVTVQTATGANTFQLEYNSGVLVGSFTVDEIVTGATSGATARIIEVDTVSDILTVYSTNATSFLNGETINTSGGSSFILSITNYGLTIPEGFDLYRDMMQETDQEPLFDASEMGVCKVKLTKAQRQLIPNATQAVQIVNGDNTYQGHIFSIKEVNLKEGIAELKFLRSDTAPPTFILDEEGDYILDEEGDKIKLEESL